MIYGDARDSFRIGRFQGSTVFLHWTWVAAVVVLLFVHSVDLLGAIGLVLGLTFVVFVHELGHVALVRAHGERALAITFYAWGGECRYTATGVDPLRRSTIAWGGVLAQAALFSVTRMVVGARTSFGTTLLDALVWTFLVVNVGMMAFNLLPVPGLDGFHALRLPLHAYRHLRARRTADAALRKVRRKTHLRLVGKDDVR